MFRYHFRWLLHSKLESIEAADLVSDVLDRQGVLENEPVWLWPSGSSIARPWFCLEQYNSLTILTDPREYLGLSRRHRGENVLLGLVPVSVNVALYHAG